MTVTRPIRPTAYDDYLAARMEPAGPGAVTSAAVAGADAVVGDRLAERVEALAAGLVALSHDIHAHPEVGFEEKHACAAVARLLREHGHEVQTGVYGLETAFASSVGSGGPRVAILAEYDALPGIGHACGHNVICASAVGAFLALVELIETTGGSVVLIGTPAEEGGGGKELIARAGGFDGVDAAMMVHPAGSDVAECNWVGLRQMDVVYTGIATHAAAMPFMGRNALDGVVAAYNGVAQLRQHMLPTDRVHGIITDGGQKPNIVPERAAASFFARSETIQTLEELTARLGAIFEGAALSTGTGLEVAWDVNPLFLPVRNNRALAGRYARNLVDRGRQVVQAAAIPSGSTDMGNVSVRIPSIHPKIAIADPSVSLHSAEFVRSAASQRGDLGVIDGAIGLARTAADYLSDGVLREQVQAEFEATGGVVDVPALDG